ncbi:S41 family peptidase [Alkaliphilus hydrothermalis]|uniref:Tail specific protease domain-containing protein n=1 Tax=Alkaliphilus hydrothermalis TaxID=1482730 RepID=A0ABS2NLU3_9FIRM|nr:S41 family peptidase [Alkaliphilus hydrothermalis]MBM7613802.1 hypothetical protein [Alkaliphilus hydrothermalis]
MKKLNYRITMIAVLLMTLVVFTACGKADEQLTTNEQMTSDEELTSEEQLTIEDFLSDFDYLMQTMEDTYPYFGVVERRLGVDIRALGRETRAMIENYPYSLEGRAKELGISLKDMPELDEHVFWSIIRHELFSDFIGFGHAIPFDYARYNYIKPSYTKSTSPFNTVNNYEVFTNPVALSFYQEQEALFKNLADNKSDLFQFIFRQEPPTGGSRSRRPMVETEIIEEDRIAYLKLAVFAPNLTSILELKEFYDNIQGYEHLIIDIRDNGGGSSDFWRMYMMKALWPEDKNMPDMPLYAFYRDSELGKYFGEDNIQTTSKFSTYKPETDELLTVNEMMDLHDLPHINVEDLEDLAYGVRFSTSIENIEEQHIRQFGFKEISQPFNGKIWLLTNGSNFSAAALFARHAKEMDFATLVGGETGGAYTAGAGAHFALPNTGIILRWDTDYLTDSEGRSLNEFTTTPHHYNRPDMDALETALQLIEEGKH